MNAAENTTAFQNPAAPLPEAARVLLATYAGPALYVENGQSVASNTAAATLLERSGWWSEVESWLRSKPRAPLLVKIPTDASPITMEWTTITLSDTQQVLIGRNITLEKNLQEVLTDSRDRFRDLVELTADLAFETGPDGAFTYIAGGKSLGYRPEELLGRHGRNLLVQQPMRENINFFETDEPVDKQEAQLYRADGSVARVLISARPLRTSRGEPRGVRGICRDVTEALDRQEELAQVQRRDRLIAEFVKSLRDVQDAKTALEIAAREIAEALNAAGCRIYNLDAQGTLQMATESGMALPEAVNGFNRRLQNEGGRALTQEAMPSAALMGATTLQGAHINGAIWVWRPTERGGSWDGPDKLLLSEVADHLGIVIAQLDYQEKLRILSECDGLTRLLNRRTFMEKLGAKIGAPGNGSALFYIDLDNFKAVNDTHGHQRGDLVIKKLADVLHHTARPSDLAGRMGGDEFVLWVDGVSRADAESLARRLVNFGGELRNLSASPQKPLGVSVGVAMIPPGEVLRTTQLMEKADAAMYQAKRGGKSTWAVAD